MSDLLGYSRVSTRDQDPALQLDALTDAGCSRIFTDHASGTVADRPELTRALDHLRPGDTLIVWRLDRLGRSLRHLIDRSTRSRSGGSASAASASQSTPPHREAGSSSTCSVPWLNSSEICCVSARTLGSPPLEPEAATAGARAS
jgi:hypothetical protein